MTSPTPPPEINAEIVAYYQKGFEAQRLLRGTGQLEFLRTREILQRFLPPPPAEILDLGGGAGIYSLWLARQGYRVHLVDITPLHIEQAREASRLQPGFPLASITLGDARRLEFPDDSLDAVLVMGPMYHLTERPDRLAALREARRVLKLGGVACIAAISCFALFIDGLRDGSFADPDFVAIVKQDLASGQHRNPHPDRDYFTTAFFHHPNSCVRKLLNQG